MQTPEYARMRSVEDRYWWFVSRRRLALDLLKAYHAEARQVLDCGCGTGALMSELDEAGYEPHGLDFSEVAIDFCQQRGLPNLHHGDAQSMPYSPDGFDAVISLDTLEHIPDDTAAMAEISRILRPGGVLIANVPAYRWLWGPHDVALMHQRRYTRSLLLKRLREAGFTIEWASYGIFFLFPVVLAIRLRDKLRRGPAEVRLPPTSDGLNRFLVGLQEMEGSLSRKIPLPWGSSIAVVARKSG